MDSQQPPTWARHLLDVTDGPGSAPGDSGNVVDLGDLVDLVDLVASRVVTDTDLPSVEPAGTPVTVVVSGGAGQVAGPAGLAVRRGLALHAVRVTLRDPADLRGNARRVLAAVDAARAEGGLAERARVTVGLPDAEPGPDWLAAVDELAAAELAVHLPVDGADPLRVAAWLEAVLDRETPLTVAGGDPLGVLAAVRLAFDGAGAVEVARALGEPAQALAGLDETALEGARRWLLGVQTGPAGPGVLAGGLGGLGVWAGPGGPG